MQKRTPSPVGVRLAAARGLADVTARELDRLAHTTEGHASLIESGVVQNVTLDTASKLARVLGVTLDWLVAGSGEDPSEASVRAAVDASRALRADESGEHPAIPDARSITG